MKTGKLIRILTAVIALVILTSCATGGGGRSEEAGATAVIDMPTPENIDEQQTADGLATDEPDIDIHTDASKLNINGTITVTVNNESETEAESMSATAVIAAFMKDYPGTSVIYDECSRVNYSTRLSAGDIGDVFWGDTWDMHNYHSEYNAIIPLEEYLDPLSINVEDIMPGALASGIADGRLYMAPHTFKEQILIYNLDLLTEAGFTIDNTVAMSWESFKELCKQLTKIDEDGRIVQVGASMNVCMQQIWELFFCGFGGQMVDTVNHRIHITDNYNVMKGANELLNAILEGWLYPEDMVESLDGRLGDFFGGITDTFAQAVFKSFSSLNWLWTYRAAYDALGDNWDFCPFPAFPTHVVSGTSTGYMVYNRTGNRDTAAAFALYCLTPSGQRACHSETGGCAPLLKSIAGENFWYKKETGWDVKNYGAFVSYSDLTVTSDLSAVMPLWVADVFSSSEMMKTIAAALRGSRSLEDGLLWMQMKANDRWAEIDG